MLPTALSGLLLFSQEQIKAVRNKIGLDALLAHILKEFLAECLLANAWYLTAMGSDLLTSACLGVVSDTVRIRDVATVLAILPNGVVGSDLITSASLGVVSDTIWTSMATVLAILTSAANGIVSEYIWCRLLRRVALRRSAVGLPIMAGRPHHFVTSDSCYYVLEPDGLEPKWLRQ